jgi:[protein-PII] uridylyltransferase
MALRLAAVSAERDLPMSRASLNELARVAESPPEPWPDEVRASLVRVLAAGPRAVRALEALDHYGILSQLLPEWDTVRNKPQRNAYHRYTVDRHLLEAAANAAALTVRVARSDLLLIAALLHDIGKGSPGDHTDAGIEIVDRIAARMGFPPQDVDTLVNLVRNHLLLSELATRRDLDDPATIDAVTRAVGDRQTLDLLAALTEADSLATGPAAWGPWKAGLVADLVRRAAAVLSGDELPPPATALLSAEHRNLLSDVRARGASARPVVIAEHSRVTVVAPDKPGLLSSVTGVLCLHGLDLRSADVAGEDGVALEVFAVEPAHGRWPDWAAVSSDLDDVLAGRLELDEQLAKRAATYGRRPVGPGPVDVKVTVDNGASAGSTVVEIRARDEVALLHDVTAALFASGLDVVAARACTIGDQVIDAFYVRDRATGAKVDDPDRLRQVGAAVQELLLRRGDERRKGKLDGDRDHAPAREQ